MRHMKARTGRRHPDMIGTLRASWAVLGLAWLLILGACNGETVQTDAKDITAFAIVRPAATGLVDEQARTITVPVPLGTDRRSMVAHFTSNGTAVIVDGVTQTSDVSPNDFTAPVRYTVTASDGSRNTYVVSVVPGLRELFVANANNDTVSVFALDPQGRASPLRVFGNITGLNAPVAVAVDDLQGEVFTVNQRDNVLNVHSRGANGNVTPLRSISGARTGLKNARALAIDSRNGLVFVATSAPGILVFRSQDHGDVAPLRVLAGQATGLVDPVGVAVDPESGVIAVADGAGSTSSLRIFAHDSQGDIAPIRVIAGQMTGLAYLTGLAIDPASREVFAAEQLFGSVLSFGLDDAGNMTPRRRVFTPLGTSSLVQGIGFDRMRDEIVISDRGVIVCFDRQAQNSTGARRLLAGNELGPISSYALAVDAVAGDVLVSSSEANAVWGYGVADSGQVSPRRSLSPASTGLRHPVSIAVDPLEDEIFVANAQRSVNVYRRTALGDVQPLRTLSGSLTGLSNLVGLALHPSRREFYVAQAHVLSAFGLADAGDVAPRRVLQFANSSHSAPAPWVDETVLAIAVDEARDQITVASYIERGLSSQGTGLPCLPQFLPCLSFISEGSLSTHLLADSSFVTLSSHSVPNQPFVLATDATSAETWLVRAFKGNSLEVRVAGIVTRTISGDATRLQVVSGLVVDPIHDLVFVTDRNGALLAFPRGASGDVAPVQFIDLGASGPVALALW